MDIEAISGAATVALASTLVFILVTKSWQILSRTVGSNSKFASSIMHEAAQRFRDEFERLTSSQSTYLSASLVFVVLYSSAYVLNAERLFVDYPIWQLYLILAILVAAALFAFYRLTKTILARQKIKLLRDANIAIGHQLQRIAAGFGRVYHDVETANGIVDHVIVGQGGIYAVNVFACRAIKDGAVAIQNNDLQLLPGDRDISIVDTIAKTSRLERELGALLHHRLKIRSVIAVPGWQVDGQASEDHLVVNENNLPMLLGWKDKDDNLMNEDVDAIHAQLTLRCRKASEATPKI
jgi:hypothetical protein